MELLDSILGDIRGNSPSAIGVAYRGGALLVEMELPSQHKMIINKKGKPILEPRIPGPQVPFHTLSLPSIVQASNTSNDW